MAGSVDDINFGAVPVDGGIFGENGNAPLFLQVVGIHNQLRIGAELLGELGLGLLQKSIHQRSFPMINMGNNGYISNVFHNPVKSRPMRPFKYNTIGVVRGKQTLYNDVDAGKKCTARRQGTRNNSLNPRVAIASIKVLQKEFKSIKTESSG